MKRLYILIILTFWGLLTNAQKAIDLNSRNGRQILDSLNHVYLETDKDTNLRKDILDWPLFYDQAFYVYFDKMYQDINQKHLTINFSDLRADYFISENGNIDYLIYELIPAKNHKIKEVDREYLKSFVLKNHQIELASKKKYRHHDVLLFEPIKL